MEDSSKYSFVPKDRLPVPLSSADDFIGAMLALRRAALKAVERARRAGLEPVVMHPMQIQEAALREDPAPYRTKPE